MKTIMLSLLVILSAILFQSCSRRTYIGPPPPPRVEVIPVAPSPYHVWVNGYYGQRHSRYVWHPGHYVRRRR